MKVIDAPLVASVQFTAYNGDIKTGVHVATLATDTGLTEYLIVYDPGEDKVMAFAKRYMNPEDPADFDIVGVDQNELLNEISYFCNKEGLFDHLPKREDIDNLDEAKTDEE